LDSNLPPEEKTRKRLLDEALILTGAGGLSTAHFLTVATFHLLNNPEMMKRLKLELEKAIPDPKKMPPLPELEKLPFLHQIIQETFRVSYGIGHRMPRIAPNEALEFHGWTIPPGTPCSMTTMFVHDDPEIFPNPSEFRPERWANSEDDRRLSKHLMNFGRGTRSCLGKELANVEIHFALAAIMRRLDFELFETDTSDVEFKHDFFSPMPKLDSKGVRVIVH
jgi:cytochrome P450